MSARREMSFLPDEENANSFSARVVKWATTAGRFVIVFTELIVVSAFLSRFWLDRTNSDLSESVRQQKAILESTQEFEVDYLNLQRRLKLVRTLYDNQPNYPDRLMSLASSVPPEVIFEQLSLEQNPKDKTVNARVSLFTRQESAIVDLITNLLVNPDIATVDIQTIEKKPKSNQYDVNLSLTFAAEKK